MSASGDAAACVACRGTGKVISGLGGTPHEVVCPWCEGSGHRIPGIDAQEHPSESAPAPEEGAAAEGDTAAGASADAEVGEPPAADAT
jgi:hypothetical protein